MWYSSHRSDTGTLSARCRRRIVALSSAENWRRFRPFSRLFNSLDFPRFDGHGVYAALGLRASLSSYSAGVKPPKQE